MNGFPAVGPGRSAAIRVAVLLLCLASCNAAWGASPTLINVHDGLLDVNATQTSLGEVLREIGSAAGIKVVLLTDLPDPITSRFRDVPLEEGLQRLLGSRSVAFVHEAAGPEGSGAPALASVWVFPRGSEASVAPRSRSQAAAATKPAPDSPPPRYYGSGIAAIESARSLDDADAVGLLEQVLSAEDDPGVREMALSELGEIGGDAAVKAIAGQFGDRDAGVRRHAVEVLGEVEHGSATQLLGQALLGDRDPQVRLSALEALARLPGPAATAFLTTATNDADEQVREAASRFLEQR